MRVWNATPHSIRIMPASAVTFNPEIRKWVAEADATPVAIIESTGMLSAKIDTVDADPISNIPVFDKKVVGCDPLPDGMTDEDIIIVSALYATAYKRTYGDDTRLYTIADPVYTSDGRTILGSRGVCPAF